MERMNRINKIREFLEKTPEDSFLQHALALEYIKAGDDAKAKELFETILKREPDYIGSYYHLGKVLERLGSHEEALLCYEEGMMQCKKLNDQHAYNELRSAFDDLV